ncbi:heavy metal translocating P-type ATPase [Bradyrhizobium septentrionale]|uniref:Cadmium-translocating P-type ATPase n=1 Tax=Bradyrhizobium septentrionale TaxID=1404411 RepID=A0A974A361_9BRAD|nr:heavy metal translocating P-type ATPase [Bradyrhizobium septentrionale]UGY15626.1 cadmium-translocating P-type ATPase [Bradyrhizobium septentrionale]UGY24202.1 cadmium-translocating P-type ATPase [Bradyrhizobium septentrionale]
MSCCAPGADLCLDKAGTSNEEILLSSRTLRDGLRQTDLSVPDIHCGGCLQRIEAALSKLDGVTYARANLSARRVTIQWCGDTPPPLIPTLTAIGYQAHIRDVGADGKDPALSKLLLALAVAGFATSNIMLLSVANWSGTEAGTRDLFHWISAAIALPTLAYSGQVFFRSAWRSLRRGQTNMDVPISIGVLLAFSMSLWETIGHGPHAYFDASVSLLFFLLIGRTLDHVMRERARQAVNGLARLSARGALWQRPDGAQIYLPVDEIEPGMTILLAAGERVAVDCRVIGGHSELDYALVSGESAPQPAAEGMELQAGILNLTAPLTVVATAAAKNSFLAEMVRMMEAAEAGRSAYRRIADRAARLYAPVVHATALLTFVGWMVATGDAHRAITIAIAVLIITCPCALGLAVPMVHVVAARRLFDLGIMIKDGSALERLAGVDTVIFDKTGTLTTGRPLLTPSSDVDVNTLALAGTIAAHSRHPYSRALAALSVGGKPTRLDAVAEFPGAGLEALSSEGVLRLGRPDWAVAERPLDPAYRDANVLLSCNGSCIAAFRLEDSLRAGAHDAIAELKRSGLHVEILSGDSETRVGTIADRLGVTFAAAACPADKVVCITTEKAAGRKVLMVGDGLNDAPALMAADVSIAPGSAADVGRNAADFVFLRESLLAVPQALAIARDAARLVRQNFGLAIAYNVVAIPVAVLGHVTPLIAAVAMSLSSVIVVANALRLHGGSRISPPMATTIDRAAALNYGPVK